jgi:hypothetical protein
MWWLFLAFVSNVYASNQTVIINQSENVPPLLETIRNLPYPLGIYEIVGGVIIPWVLCLIITGAITVVCCCCGYCRKKKKTVHKIIVEPRGGQKNVEF